MSSWLFLYLSSPHFFLLKTTISFNTKTQGFRRNCCKGKSITRRIAVVFNAFFHTGTAFDMFILISAVSVPFVAVLFSRPQDFLLDREQGPFQDKKCLICRKRFSSDGVGKDMRRHIEKWQLNLRRFVMWIFETHSSINLGRRMYSVCKNGYKTCQAI